MIDPVYGSIPFVKRRSQFPADPSIFRQIDYLLISHDHFDHLDKPSVARLVADNPQLKLFCGLNTGALIKSWFPNLEVIEAAWYEQYVDGDFRLTFLPAQHWSKRGVSDGGERLWGSFMIQGDGITIYNSGDTGYARHFEEIAGFFFSYRLLHGRNWSLQTSLVYEAESYISIRCIDCFGRFACKGYNSNALWHF